MKILLVKCHKKTIYSYLQPIVCEPLELEYISAVLNEKKIDHMILDHLLDGKNFKDECERYNPDVLLLSGYITAVETILSYSDYAKDLNPNVKIIVGGSHAEINYEDFFSPSIDIVVHQSGLSVIDEMLKCLETFDIDDSSLKKVKGIAYQFNQVWQVNDKSILESYDMPIPDRSFFNRYKSKTRYMLYPEVAIVKTSISCPFQCEFCYCRKINQGIYLTRKMADIIKEMQQIDTEHIWIVDDTFLIDPLKALAFIKSIKAHGINKKFIAYSRVDFIAQHPDIIKDLKDIGFIELIVGIEDISNSKLESYHKGTNEDYNEKAIQVLKDHEIRLTALFIAGIDFRNDDFRRMKQWIRLKKIDCYTVSVFTPMKGTDLYDLYKGEITTNDLSRFDFLHLVMKPIHMSRLRFYIHFYSLYFDQIFRSGYIRKFLFRLWFGWLFKF
ncbi:MAG: cobalamin-dependent protein [Eubacteriales bacterium]|nr:cobalamin-dependent protein [Eubacteriales bacterium]